MKKTILANTLLLVAGASLMFSACTDKFEDFNTDPKAPTPDQMKEDYASTASLINTMIPVMVLGQENDYQMIDQMIGYEYGRMTSAKNAWGSAQYYATYNPPVGWMGNCFDTNMPKMYTPFFMIRNITGSDGITYHWANLVRIFGTLRVSDCYGPLPFSKIGTGSDFAVAYDDMPELFDAMFAELDNAMAGLKAELSKEGAAATAKSLFGTADILYQGDLQKWLRLANTLKLRMAMRLVNVNPTLAKQKAEEAVASPDGLIDSGSNAAWSTFLPGGNSWHKTNILWDESRVSADITSYMNGYADPRLDKYAKPIADGSYNGLRSGIFNSSNTLVTTSLYSAPVVTQTSPLLCISGSESWFSRAEGALRGWNMGGTAKELYEQGVKVSMEERGATIGSYLDCTDGPADYVDSDPSHPERNIAAQSTIAPKYDEGASFDENLERIIVQKWLGNYPNGWETWADFRRTGYPKFFPVVDNRSTDGVTDARGVRRLPFPQSEFNTNEANVKAAQGYLGGPDNTATDLWWALKN